MKSTERKNMMTFEEINNWVASAKKGEKVLYYKGFFAEDAKNKYEFRKFSEDLLNFERKTRSFILYQKKIESGHLTKKPLYEYYIEKN